MKRNDFGTCKLNNLKTFPSIVVSPAAFGNGSDPSKALVGIDRVNVCKLAAGEGERICVSQKDKRKLPKPTK